MQSNTNPIISSSHQNHTAPATRFMTEHSTHILPYYRSYAACPIKKQSESEIMVDGRNSINDTIRSRASGSIMVDVDPIKKAIKSHASGKIW